MYQEGNIIYFTPFYFKNGNPAKPKYFVILKVNDANTIMASLPTSKDHIPAKDVVKSGCIELPEINLNCFVFSPEETVTECNKSFPFMTYIYGSQLDFYNLADMYDIYRNDGIDYVLWGKMKQPTFNRLKQCLKNSKAVKQKFIRLL